MNRDLTTNEGVLDLNQDCLFGLLKLETKTKMDPVARLRPMVFFCRMSLTDSINGILSEKVNKKPSFDCVSAIVSIPSFLVLQTNVQIKFCNMTFSTYRSTGSHSVKNFELLDAFFDSKPSRLVYARDFFSVEFDRALLHCCSSRYPFFLRQM